MTDKSWGREIFFKEDLIMKSVSQIRELKQRAIDLLHEDDIPDRVIAAFHTEYNNCNATIKLSDTLSQDIQPVIECLTPEQIELCEFIEASKAYLKVFATFNDEEWMIRPVWQNHKNKFINMELARAGIKLNHS